ncbi:unnamed protein product [Blepharisma stoltei]|uniref:Dickkopf N-terminal cysteine-rich domain-containing protein n=1 Tax=Blepharisma stoltei TaxID=1481888 RepID=A0AAU9IIX5_9CILI|nr:unnamed protein product [Blepharisma stoltei]
MAAPLIAFALLILPQAVFSYRYDIEENKASAPSCPSYACKKSSQTFEQSQCAYYDESDYTYYVNPCAQSTESCMLKGENPGNHTCQTAQTKLSWPGEKCTQTGDCNPIYSTACTNGICVGLSSGVACTDSNYCNPGLSCQGTPGSMKCAPLIQAGSKGCRADFDCVPYAGCNITSTTDSSENACVQYWSIKNDEFVAICGEHQSNLCKYNLCRERDGGFKCYEKFENTHIIPWPCDLNAKATDCNFTHHEFNFLPDCVCGLNPTGAAYCSLIPGDGPVIEYEAALKSWLFSTSSSQCNTLRRFESQCILDFWGNTKGIYALMYWYLYMSYYPQIQDTQDCVLKTFYPSYVSYKELYKKYDDQDDGAAMLELVFFTYILAIFN